MLLSLLSDGSEWRVFSQALCLTVPGYALAYLLIYSEFPVFLIVDSKLVLNLDMVSYSSLFLLADQPFYCFALRQGLIQ